VKDCHIHRTATWRYPRKQSSTPLQITHVNLATKLLVTSDVAALLPGCGEGWNRHVLFWVRLIYLQIKQEFKTIFWAYFFVFKKHTNNIFVCNEFIIFCYYNRFFAENMCFRKRLQRNFVERNFSQPDEKIRLCCSSERYCCPGEGKDSSCRHEIIYLIHVCLLHSDFKAYYRAYSRVLIYFVKQKQKPFYWTLILTVQTVQSSQLNNIKHSIFS